MQSWHRHCASRFPEYDQSLKTYRLVESHEAERRADESVTWPIKIASGTSTKS
jgi:hypothetical protein